jgi:rubrerythrin
MDFVTIRDGMTCLEEAGLGPEMEQVPAATPTEARRPRWNLYVPAAEVEEARRCLRRDWADMVEGAEAALAMQRGEEALALDGGAEIACPACGHRFTPVGADAECPDCGLGLGVPGGAVEDDPQ